PANPQPIMISAKRTCPMLVIRMVHLRTLAYGPSWAAQHRIGESLAPREQNRVIGRLRALPFVTSATHRFLALAASTNGLSSFCLTAIVVSGLRARARFSMLFEIGSDNAWILAAFARRRAGNRHHIFDGLERTLLIQRARAFSAAGRVLAAQASAPPGSGL